MLHQYSGKLRRKFSVETKAKRLVISVNNAMKSYRRILRNVRLEQLSSKATGDSDDESIPELVEDEEQGR